MQTNKKVNELVLWHEFDGPGDISINVLEKICKMYSERNYIKINPVAKNIYEITAYFRGDKRGNEAPDMAFLPSDFVIFANTGRFSEIPDNIFKDLISENSLKTMNFSGKQYGLPVIGGNHLVLYYNKDIFPSGLLEWKELKQKVDELQKKKIIPVSLDICQLYWILPILSAFDAWPVKGCDPGNINYLALKDAFRFIDTMMKQGIVGTFDASTEMLEKFFDGKIGAIIAGEWSYGYIMRNLGEKAGVCAIPAINGRKCTSTTSTLGLVYVEQSLQSEYRDELLGFGKFLLSEECQMMWLNEVDRIPLNVNISQKIKNSASQNKRIVLEEMYASHPLLITETSKNLWPVMELGKELFWQRCLGIDETIEKMKEKVQLLNAG
ncbi:MAG: extracellular solute-binding protein [Clostridia bacterium]|nr:extracellular solute-binding protein [Clostridia bacterium]